MNDEIGRGAREVFLEALKQAGTECHAAGERTRALIQEGKSGGPTVFKFANEFELNEGDKIRNWATEEVLTVIKTRPVSTAGCFNHFEVTVR